MLFSSCKKREPEMTAKIRLIAFDLDDTLLDKEKRLSPENREALLRAAEGGISLVPATGRMFPVIPEYIRTLPGVRYAITTNGSDVFDSVENRFVYRAHIPAATALEVLDFLAGADVLYDCNMENRAYMNAPMHARIGECIDDPAYAELVRTVRRPVENVRELLAGAGTDVQKIQAFSNVHPHLEEVLEALRVRFPQLSVCSSQRDNIEINVKGADKGLALKALAEHLGLDRSEVMAIGDGFNDLPMVAFAGAGVAMGNAVPALKEAAVYTTLSCDENGFAKAVSRFCFGD